MRVLFAPGAFGGTAPTPEVAGAMADGWRRGAPADELVVIPMGQAETDLLGFVSGICDAKVEQVVVRGPRGAAVTGRVAIVTGATGRTAYVDAAPAIGPSLGATSTLGAGAGSSAGVGDLLQAALDAVVNRIVVRVVAGGVIDGGAGLLGALGVEPAHQLVAGGHALADLDHVDPLSLRAARGRFRGVDLVLVTSEELPLLGFHGVSATRGFAADQPEQAQSLERSLGRLVDALTAAHGHRDLLTGRARRIDKERGAGAGGGVGLGLLMLGATCRSVTQELGGLVDLADEVARADLVVTGVEHLDALAVSHGVLVEVTQLAAAAAVPVIALSVESSLGRREAMALGLSGAYALATRADERRQLKQDPLGALAARAQRLARTWSPTR